MTTHLSLFAEYRGYLFSLAQRILGSGIDAEDLLQETFTLAPDITRTDKIPQSISRNCRQASLSESPAIRSNSQRGKR